MKKVFTLILGLLFASSLQLHAAYLTNIKKTLTQPDGSVIECFASGDEFHNWLHDKDNYTIIQAQDGYYYYAQKVNDKIVPSEYKVGTTHLKSTDLTPGINISADQWKAKREKKVGNMPYKASNFKSDAPEMTIHKIAIYVRFQDDAEWAKDTATYWDMLNDETPTATSMINFYKEVSYGKVEVQSHFFPRSTTATVVSYQDTQNRGYFQPYNVNSNPEGYDPDETDSSAESHPTKREWDLLERVITDFKNNYTIPAEWDLDWNDDGFIDNIEFHVLGEAGAWADLLWPHNWAIQDRVLTIDGLKVFDYNFQIEEITDQRGAGVLSHEMGHALGYPDLYHYRDEWGHISPVGPWDIMNQSSNPPQSFGAYTKFKYGGWIDEIPEITTAGTYSLKSIDSASNNCYKIASPYTTDEYFVLEYRKKAGRFENSLPGSGLLIYRINTAAGRGNAQGPPDEVYLYRPGGTVDLNGTPNQAHFSSNVVRTEINNTTDPKPFLTDGSIGGLYISNVSGPGETISFDVAFNPDALYPDFSASEDDIFAWESVDFTDESIGSPETWEWVFEGGTPSSFSGQNPPSIVYNTPGTFDVSLTVTKGSETLVENREDFITVSAVPGTNPPRDLAAEVTEGSPNDVVLNWTEPESGIQELTLQWDDGTNAGDGITLGDTDPAAYSILSRWDPSDLTAYNDWYITEISFLAFEPEQASGYSYALEVYTGTDAGTQVTDQAVAETSINYDNWHTVELTTPVQIDASEILWFGVHHDSGTNNAGFLFGIDNDTSDPGKGDIIYDDSGFAFLSDFNINKNWHLAATVVNALEEPKQKSARITKAMANTYKSMDGYNVYRDGVKVNSSVITETTYTDAGVADGNYDYTVTAVYTAGESLASNIANINVPYSVGIPEVEIKDISIFPNPAIEDIKISIEELINQDITINVYDQAGKLVYSENRSYDESILVIPISELANGAYTLVVYTDDNAFKGKFIVMK